MALATLPRRTPPADAYRPTAVTGRVAAWVVRHRRVVLVLWAVVFVAGGMAAGKVTNRLKVDFSLPGQPGYETALHIQHVYGTSGDGEDGILVVTAPGGRTVAGEAGTIAAAFAAVRAAEPQLRVVDFGNTGDPRFVTADGHSTYALLEAPLAHGFGSDKSVTAAERMVAQRLPGYQVGLTGLNQLQSGGSSKGPGVFVETLIGGVGALAVLAFVFASLLALVPIVVAAVSILATFLVILGLTYVTDVSFIVEFLVALVGLGIAIDYSLLLVTRWREQRAHGFSNADAVVSAADTAGRAVVLSGLTVAIGLVSLVVLPVPGLRSTGIGGMLIPLVSIVVVSTLLPALLAGIGPRVDWPRLRHEDHASRFWSRWATVVVRHRWWATTGALAVLAVAIIPVFGLKVGMTSADAQAKTGAAHDTYQQLLHGGVAAGVLTPMDVLTTAAVAPQVAAEARAVPGIADAVLATGPSGTRDGLSTVVLVPREETVNNTTLTSVDALENALRARPGVIGVTGLGPIEQDYSHAVFGNFPLMFALIAIITFLLLARAFRSLLLALKAVVLNLVSLAATFGLLAWFWQEGHGSSAVFGIPATGAITFWVPLMVFAFLFGLSMDYEVFILTRVREEYDAAGDTVHAVVEGLGRTGRLVTSAALILFLAFASLASAPDTDLKVLATGLGAGILLDATVVRALLVPALVSLFGRWNWWLPRPLASVLRVRREAPALAEANA
ncbi:MAG TPA: MMPL family transporter [Acidimicrobiales bacterium]|nr:MMPL family transporter [Acidimicrobiales bacterium]